MADSRVVALGGFGVASYVVGALIYRSDRKTDAHSRCY